MTNRHKLQGKRAKSNGKAFEELIEHSCRLIRKMGLANIQKTPEPLKPIGVLRGGQFRAIYDRQGQPDFMGTLLGGQSIVLEAKHTSSTNIRFDSVLSHQARQLALTDELGGVAGVLISFSMKDFYHVPYATWRELEKTIGKKSLNENDLAEYRISTDNGFLDFLR